MNSIALAEAILATDGDAIVAIDSQGIVQFWNPGARRTFGFSEQDAIGRPLDFIIPENLRERHKTGFERAMRSGETRYGSGDLLSVPALTKNGSRISVEFTITLLRNDPGAIVGIVAIMRDVTERFDQLRTLRAKLAATATPV